MIPEVAGEIHCCPSAMYLACFKWGGKWSGEDEEGTNVSSSLFSSTIVPAPVVNILWDTVSGFGDPPISKCSHGPWPLGTYRLVIGGDHDVLRALGVLVIYVGCLLKSSQQPCRCCCISSALWKPEGVYGSALSAVWWGWRLISGTRVGRHLSMLLSHFPAQPHKQSYSSYPQSAYLCIGALGTRTHPWLDFGLLTHILVSPETLEFSLAFLFLI